VISARGDETICYRGRICQLPLSKRAAQVFSHSMKPVKNEKHCSSTESWSRLNASRAAHSSSLAYTISCKNVQILNHEDKRWPFAYHFEKIESWQKFFRNWQTLQSLKMYFPPCKTYVTICKGRFANSLGC